MSEQIKSPDALLLVLLTALAAAWGIAGALDVSQRTHPGFTISNDFEIVSVRPGGPAEGINMQVGDRVIRIDGHPVEDTATLTRLPRVKEGERRSYTVSRGDQTIRYRPAFEKLSVREQAIAHLRTIVGFAFLLIPLVACFTRPKPATRILALMGLGLSMHFFVAPYIASYDVRAIALAVSRLFLLLGLAAMVHFLLVFPRQRALIDKSWCKKLLYWPVLLMWFADAWRLLFTPPAASIASKLVQGFSDTGVLAYVVLGLILLIANYAGSESSLKKETALFPMLLATIIAIAPVTLAGLASTFSPETVLPGQAYYFALLALVPMSWSISAAR